MWGQAVIIVVGAFTSMLSSTIADPALPHLAARFGTSQTSTQWVATGYLLALAAGVPLSGWLSRRLGPTRLWLASLVLFCGFSVWCALANTLTLLLIGRIAEGLSGGLLVPAGQTILALVAGRERLGRVMSTVGIAIVVAPTLGTTVGSVMLGHLGTGWLFWINVPLCAIAFLTGLRWLPRVATNPAGRLDWIGLMLILAGLPLLLYGIAAIGNASGLTSVSADLYTVAGVVLLVAFTAWELRRASPLLRISIFGDGIFAAGAIAMLLGGAVNFGAQVILPLFFTEARGDSLLTAGLLIGPQVIGTAIGFPLAGYLSDRYGAGVLVLVGALITALATLPLALVHTHTPYGWLAVVLAIRGFGVALSTIPAMTAGLAAVHRDHLPDAAPILNMLQRTGASLGTAVIGVIYATHLTNDTQHSATTAFAYANWWLLAATLILAAAAYLLTHAERTTTRPVGRGTQPRR